MACRDCDPETGIQCDRCAFEEELAHLELAYKRNQITYGEYNALVEEAGAVYARGLIDRTMEQVGEVPDYREWQEAQAGAGA